MAHAAQGGPKPPSTHFGRTFLIGGSVVAAGLAGVWLSMLRSKRLQEESGRNPLFEQTIAAASKKPSPTDDLPLIQTDYNAIPPAFPGKDHHSGHSTHKNWKEQEGYTEYGKSSRRMVPPPQRAKADDPNKAYTKSPDYVQNYGKTKRPSPPGGTGGLKGSLREEEFGTM